MAAPAGMERQERGPGPSQRVQKSRYDKSPITRALVVVVSSAQLDISPRHTAGIGTLLSQVAKVS